jgi:hypothetical protein
LWEKRIDESGSLCRLDGTGKSRKLTPLERRDIVLKAKREPLITANEIREEIGREDVCINTILRPIHEDGTLKSYWQTNKVMISKVNQIKRVKWCKEHLHWTSDDWNKVLFSDESPFVIRFNGKKRVWRRHNERYHAKAMKGSFKHDSKINVWGCFCGHGVGQLHRIHGIMDSKVYIKILDNVMMPSKTKLFKRKPYFFQQDNDPKHKSKLTMEHMVDWAIPFHAWPPQSPDLNPIENLWSILDQKCRNRKPRDADILFNMLEEAWNALDVTILGNLVESMHERLLTVIEAKGLPTHY